MKISQTSKATTKVKALISSHPVVTVLLFVFVGSMVIGSVIVLGDDSGTLLIISAILLRSAGLVLVGFFLIAICVPVVTFFLCYLLADIIKKSRD